MWERDSLNRCSFWEEYGVQACTKCRTLAHACTWVDDNVQLEIDTEVDGRLCWARWSALATNHCTFTSRGKCRNDWLVLWPVQTSNNSFNCGSLGSGLPCPYDLWVPPLICPQVQSQPCTTFTPSCAGDILNRFYVQIQKGFVSTS